MSAVLTRGRQAARLSGHGIRLLFGDASGGGSLDVLRRPAVIAVFVDAANDFMILVGAFRIRRAAQTGRADMLFLPWMWSGLAVHR